MSGPVHDVAIVGAGPAGSTLALLLARAGCDVVLADRAEFPRAKPCGDCLSAEAGRLLRRLGLLGVVEGLGPARLVGWRIVGPGGATFSAAFAELGDRDPLVHQGLAVPRARLDAALLGAAAAAGVEVLTGWRATELLADGGQVTGVRLHDVGHHSLEVRARITIGADGLRSRVARQLDAVARAPRVRKLSFTTHITRPPGLADGYGEMHVGRGTCAGLAPVSAAGDLWNLTVVADAGRFGAAARQPRAFFRAVLRGLPRLAQLGLEPAELLASGPFDRPVRRTAFPGAALVGDAAGYFDPFTGQGIYHAMAAAERLAGLLAPALRGGDHGDTGRALGLYAAAHARLTCGPRRVQRLIHQVLDRPWSAELAVAGLARRPRAAAALLAVTGDLRPAGSLLSPALALSLLFPHPTARSGRLPPAEAP